MSKLQGLARSAYPERVTLTWLPLRRPSSDSVSAPSRRGCFSMRPFGRAISSGWSWPKSCLRSSRLSAAPGGVTGSILPPSPALRRRKSAASRSSTRASRRTPRRWPGPWRRPPKSAPPCRALSPIRWANPRWPNCSNGRCSARQPSPACPDALSIRPRTTITRLKSSKGFVNGDWMRRPGRPSDRACNT